MDQLGRVESEIEYFNRIFFQHAIFNRSWLVAGRSDLVQTSGQYFSDELYQEPILVIQNFFLILSLVYPFK